MKERTPMASDDQHGETRQERRDKRLRRKREQMRKHGANLAQIYRNAVLKRLSERGARRKR
jgi:hypothetical protein